MNKIEAMRVLNGKPNTEISFLANVVFCQHSDAAKKLKTLAVLVLGGHDVRLANYSLDDLLVDGFAVPFSMLIGEPSKAAKTVLGYVHNKAEEADRNDLA